MLCTKERTRDIPRLPSRGDFPCMPMPSSRTTSWHTPGSQRMTMSIRPLRPSRKAYLRALESIVQSGSPCGALATGGRTALSWRRLDRVLLFVMSSISVLPPQRLRRCPGIHCLWLHRGAVVADGPRHGRGDASVCPRARTVRRPDPAVQLHRAGRRGAGYRRMASAIVPAAAARRSATATPATATSPAWPSTPMSRTSTARSTPR